MSTEPANATDDRRKWTDEQLRTAILREHSWRGVARALGLRPTSTVTIRRHATRLGLDTSHFTGQRPWSDQQLRGAVVASSSWAEVLRVLGVNNNGDSMSRVRGHSARLNLDVTHLEPPDDGATGLDLRDIPPQKSMLRNSALALAMAWFGLRGIPTALPMEQQAYDLLVTLPGGIKRVQVKSSTCRTAPGRWQVSVGHRPYALDKTAGRAPYDPDALDYFFIVTGDGLLYLLPNRAIAGRTAIQIDGSSRYLVGDASSLLR